MTVFREGDRVALNQDYFALSKGAEGTVEYGGARDDLISVRFDTGKRDSIFGYRFDHIGSRPSSVDDLINEYAKRLRAGIDNGTMVAPYSEIGIFAAFLLEYKKLEQS